MDHALTEQEALDALRRAGRIEAASIARLGEGWGWERSRASKAVIRWERAGRIEREPGTGRTVIIRVLEGTENVNVNGVNGTGPGQRRKAGTGRTASTGKRKAGPNGNGTVNGAGPV